MTGVSGGRDASSFSSVPMNGARAGFQVAPPSLLFSRMCVIVG